MAEIAAGAEAMAPVKRRGHGEALEAGAVHRRDASPLVPSNQAYRFWDWRRIRDRRQVTHASLSVQGKKERHMFVDQDDE